MRTKAAIMRVNLLLVLLLTLAGCTDHPKKLDNHLEQYEQLAKFIYKKVRPGRIIERNDAEEWLRKSMEELDISRVRHELDSSAIFLSGKSNIITGQFSYLYLIGDFEIDLVRLRNEGREVKYLHGRWYSEMAYFD